uniref:Ig-like domain-containing protein n=1 Tax=Taeniopygia guttata TaxID=59729 RepID=A0A674HC52_TAEGU
YVSYCVSKLQNAFSKASKSWYILEVMHQLMFCEAEGYPGPQISWHKDGQQITESMRRRILSTGALQILFVQPGDSGRYTCTAANPAGSSTSSTELAVHGKELVLGEWGALEVEELS